MALALWRIRNRLRSARAEFLHKEVLIWFAIRWLRLVNRGKPVPIGQLLSLRNMISGEDALVPRALDLRNRGRDLRNPFLASSLADKELGVWSLTASTLNFLESQIQTFKPKVVLELGSGISTACLARYMLELHGDSNQVYLFSIEQDLSFLQKTIRLLEALQLGKYARIVHSPLCQQMIEGVPDTCYDLSRDFLVRVLEGNRPDFVVIDGPAAGPGARFGTLPLVRHFLSHEARFFLDDALRDGELRIAQLWSRIPYVQVTGVHLPGKGLLVGQVAGDI